MNILVLSDSHRLLPPVRNLLRLYSGQVIIAAHLGDDASDLMDMQPEFPNLRMVAVRGNCDAGYGNEEQMLHINGKNILMVHGHRQHVKSGCERLCFYAAEKKADACLFGHTHLSTVFKEGQAIYVNPGSLSHPRPGEARSYALLSVPEDGPIRGTVLTYRDS
jgi:putative phosphoesterase